MATIPRRAGYHYFVVLSYNYENSCIRMQRGKLEIEPLSFIPPRRYTQEPYVDSYLNGLMMEGSWGPRHTTTWAPLSRWRVGWAVENFEAEPPALKEYGQLM